MKVLNEKDGMLIKALSSLAIALPMIGVSNVSGLPNVIIYLADDMGLGDTSAYQVLTGNANSHQVSTFIWRSRSSLC